MTAFISSLCYLMTTLCCIILNAIDTNTEEQWESKALSVISHLLSLYDCVRMSTVGE